MKANWLIKFYPVIFVTVVVIITTSLLALTDSFTWDKLKAQQDQQTLEMLEGIFPEASFYNLEDDSKYEVGYAFYAKGMGWGGNIVILVGLEDKETIKGINIISHSELLCVGEFGIPLDFSTFTKQFIGLKIDDCALKKNDGQVDGITGAITSSKAVVDIVRETALEKVKFIR